MLARVPASAPSRDREEERETVALAQRGDRAALGRILVAHGPVLYRSVLLPRLGSEAAAKDALAETYAKVVERVGQFEWQGTGIYPWLRTVALHVALDMLRARKRVVFWSEDDLAGEIERGEGDEGADARLLALRDEREAKAKVVAALAAIHPRYAKAVQLRVLDELPRDEAARQLDVTPATFDVVLHRALRALKKHLSPAEPGETGARDDP
jgi:RNA polymerase sigma-70 factor (ECF subfamily)